MHYSVQYWCAVYVYYFFKLLFIIMLFERKMFSHKECPWAADISHACDECITKRRLQCFCYVVHM